MDISFASKKLAKLCNSEREAKGKLGQQMAAKLMQRLFELKAAETLNDISHLPPARCHELGGDRAGQLAVDLKHPFRLVFSPDHDPVLKKDDGGLDRELVTAIIVEEIEDYH